MSLCRAPLLALLLCGGAVFAQVPGTPEGSPLPSPAPTSTPVTDHGSPDNRTREAGAVSPAAAATPGEGAVASAPSAPPYAAALRARTREVLASPDFRQRETLRLPVPRDWLRNWLKGRDSKPSATPPPNLALLGTLFQYLAVLLLALGLAWLLWRGWQWLAPRAANRTPGGGSVMPEVRYLALPDAPLPYSITTAARAAWQAGDAALALSLLYRGAVRELAQRYRIELPDSATEGECLRQARRSGAAVVPAAFAPIVQAWMALAYASHPPADFEALLALYARHFEVAAGAPS